MLQEAGPMQKIPTVVLTILSFRQIQCLHLMYAEVALVLVSSAAQVQPQTILDLDCLSVSYDYGCIGTTTYL